MGGRFGLGLLLVPPQAIGARSADAAKARKLEEGLLFIQRRAAEDRSQLQIAEAECRRLELERQKRDILIQTYKRDSVEAAENLEETERGQAHLRDLLDQAQRRCIELEGEKAAEKSRADIAECKAQSMTRIRGAVDDFFGDAAAVAEEMAEEVAETPPRSRMGSRGRDAPGGIDDALARPASAGAQKEEGGDDEEAAAPSASDGATAAGPSEGADSAAGGGARAEEEAADEAPLRGMAKKYAEKDKAWAEYTTDVKDKEVQHNALGQPIRWRIQCARCLIWHDMKPRSVKLHEEHVEKHCKFRGRPGQPRNTLLTAMPGFVLTKPLAPGPLAEPRGAPPPTVQPAVAPARGCDGVSPDRVLVQLTRKLNADLYIDFQAACGVMKLPHHFLTELAWLVFDTYKSYDKRDGSRHTTGGTRCPPTLHSCGCKKSGRGRIRGPARRHRRQELGPPPPRRPRAGSLPSARKPAVSLCARRRPQILDAASVRRLRKEGRRRPRRSRSRRLRQGVRDPVRARVRCLRDRGEGLVQQGYPPALPRVASSLGG